MTQQRCAIYARYSTDSQSPTSIDDQVRRCIELAHRHGLSSDGVLIFQDVEMSGYSAKKAHARPGFTALLAAWDAREFDVLITDEISRLARNSRQQLEVLERLEGRVRFIAANGVDTNAPGWRLMFGIHGLMAQEESRNTSFRVTRGMLGQLKRGFMIAQPPFGYRLVPVTGDDGRACGTKWCIDSAEAELVREMYVRRCRGESFGQVARWLNELGVRPSKRGKIWRVPRVRSLLSNAIYRGEFVWNGSSYSKTKARKRGELPETEIFARPELCIVSDEDWKAAQSKASPTRSGYGGGRNPFSGWIGCGCCDGLLSSTAGGKAFACAACNALRSAGAPGAPVHVPSISVGVIQAVLKYALKEVLSEPRIMALKRRLQARLEVGPDDELSRLRQQRIKAEREAQQVLSLVRRSQGQDALLEDEYISAREALRCADRALAQAEQAGLGNKSREIAMQIAVDASTLADKLLDGILPPEQVRTALAALFPAFVLLGREGRRTAVFELAFAPGAAVAWLTTTEQADTERVRLRVRVSRATEKPVTWDVVGQWVDDTPSTD